MEGPPLNLQPQGLLDWIILLAIGWGVVSGLRAGLVRSLTSLAGVLAGWAVAALLTGQVLALADAGWGVVDGLAGSLERVVPASGPAVEDAPGMAASYRQYLAPYLEDGGGAAHLLAWGIAAALTFILLFAATRLVFALVGHLLHIVFDAGPLRPLNRLGGALFGALRNGVVLALVLGLLGPAAALDPTGLVPGLIDDSVYAALLQRAFYMFNPWIFRAPPGQGI